MKYIFSDNLVRAGLTCFLLIILISSCKNQGQSKAEKTSDTLRSPRVTLLADLPDSNKPVVIFKFAYDNWGDTVNIASRMESSGEAGKVNISGSTYGLVKDIFTYIYRGKIEAKNKGEIDMYFVEK